MRIIMTIKEIPTPPSMISRLDPGSNGWKRYLQTRAIAALARTPAIAPP